jgi:hypothetical protein
MLRQKFTVQVTTLPDCDDITRFDGNWLKDILGPKIILLPEPLCIFFAIYAFLMGHYSIGTVVPPYLTNGTNGNEIRLRGPN